MNSHTELIERLEHFSEVLEIVRPEDAPTIRQAAQAISTLTAEVEELRAGYEKLERLGLMMPPEGFEIIRATLTKGEGAKG